MPVTYIYYGCMNPTSVCSSSAILTVDMCCPLLDTCAPPPASPYVAGPAAHAERVAPSLEELTLRGECFEYCVANPWHNPPFIPVKPFVQQLRQLTALHVPDPLGRLHECEHALASLPRLTLYSTFHLLVAASEAQSRLEQQQQQQPQRPAAATNDTSGVPAANSHPTSAVARFTAGVLPLPPCCTSITRLVLVAPDFCPWEAPQKSVTVSCRCVFGSRAFPSLG